MTASPPQPASPRVVVGLLLAAAALGLVAVAKVEDAPPAPIAGPSPPSEAAPAAPAPVASDAPPPPLPTLARSSDEGWGEDWGEDGWSAAPGRPPDGDWRESYRRGERVRGLVLDGQGRPRGEVQVALHADRADALGWLAAGSGRPLGAIVGERADRVARGRTGPDGVFVLPLEGEVGPDCRSLSLVACDPSDGGLVLEAVSYRAPDGEGVHELGELRLRPAHRLEVRALGGGQPVAGASIAITLRSGGERSLLFGTTDAVGALAVDVCAPDAGPGPDVELILRGPGLGSTRRELSRLAGPCALEVDLPPEVVMWGRVVDAHGRPAGGVRVAARPERPDRDGGEVEADADGRFVIGGLAEGPHTVQVRDPRAAWASTDQEVGLPSPELVLRLEVPGALLVTLVPPRTDGQLDRSWLSGVELELLRAGQGPGAWSPAVWHEWSPVRGPDEWGDDWGPEWGGTAPPATAARRLGADQRLLLGLAPGRYWLRARDPWSKAASAPVDLLVTSGAEETVTLTLVPER